MTPETTPACSCRTIPLGRIDELRGSLCVAQVGEHIPFEVKRAYWVFDVPPGGERAHHAHREQAEVLVGLRGSLTVHCDDGVTRCTHVLNSPDEGLLIPPMVFHHLDEITPDAICLVFASGPYDDSEYVHTYDEFAQIVGR